MSRALVLWIGLTAAFAQQPPATAFQDSLAKQRASVEQQMKAVQSSSFFILPPPASLGATTFAPLLAPLEADCDPLPQADVDALIGHAAQREGVDQDLVRNVIRQESAFRPCAVSNKGAMGLMQLMPATLDRLGVKNAFDPAENVNAGTRFLKELLVRYDGDLTRALGAYNAGPGKVDAQGGVPEIPETIDYIKRILAALAAKPAAPQK